MDKTYLLAALNLLVCSAVAFVCVCRLRLMRPRITLRKTQWEYALMFVAALAAGFAPWYGEWPGYADTGLACAVFYSLLSSGHVWRHNKPPPSTDRGELT